MKVLKCHSYYRVRGGEDECFDAEVALLESRGVNVLRFVRHNDAIDGMSRLSVARLTVWNHDVFRQLRALIRRERPDIVECTNSFPLLSPSVCYAARVEGVPMVQGLQNFRLICAANGFFLRDGQVCEDCLHTALPWPAVVHACYRNSWRASAVVATLQTVHRAAGTWHRAVDLFVTPSEFARRKLIDGGVPADRVVAMPNFLVTDPGPGGGRGGYAVFVGRLSREKGLSTLVDAWAHLRSDLRLKIVGDGPDREVLSATAARDARIEIVGRRTLAETLAIVGDAVCLIMPSLWYETFGRVIMEAFAVGTPVIASRLGAMGEIVTEGRTGALFEVGNAADLAGAVDRMVAAPERLAGMRAAARQAFEDKYTADRRYELMTAAYERAVQLAAGRQPGRRSGAPRNGASAWNTNP